MGGVRGQGGEESHQQLHGNGRGKKTFSFGGSTP